MAPNRLAHVQMQATDYGQIPILNAKVLHIPNRAPTSAVNLMSRPRMITQCVAAILWKRTGKYHRFSCLFQALGLLVYILQYTQQLRMPSFVDF